MYLVKIGNYFRFLRKSNGFPVRSLKNLIIFNFFLILINCCETPWRLIENRRMLLKIFLASLLKISLRKS